MTRSSVDTIYEKQSELIETTVVLNLAPVDIIKYFNAI